MNKLPKTMIYAISLVLVAIGSAIAYQVFTGSNLNYKSDMLGEITIGQGQDQTTLLEYLQKSEAALQEAQATINEQSLSIGRLEGKVENFRNEISRLRRIVERQQGERASESLSSSEVPLSAESVTRAPAQVEPEKPTRSHEALTRQIELTRNILKQIKKAS